MVGQDRRSVFGGAVSASFDSPAAAGAVAPPDSILSLDDETEADSQ
ncbi:MAG: hypothetical protein OXE79_02280 [Acidimicrobiaceae bacterium]|nr:hypothetical protein [Acidimicrobiaceae bacterium]MCY4279230.1 hypothetical protein [Acidimicrobiaceae bacterium]MCY4293746.1 hypothetical protein [Acidimicrobiaceae bacterium]